MHEFAWWLLRVGVECGIALVMRNQASQQRLAQAAGILDLCNIPVYFPQSTGAEVMDALVMELEAETPPTRPEDVEEIQRVAS